jgi:hypothetical protein
VAGFLGEEDHQIRVSGTGYRVSGKKGIEIGTKKPRREAGFLGLSFNGLADS